MVGSNKAVKIGIIAEENNDVDVLYELTCKIIKENQFAFKRFVGHGCGKLRKKSSAWEANLFKKGCTLLVVLHDLDRNKESVIRQYLENEIKNAKFDHTIILIPKEELEAWLLSDKHALKAAFKMRVLPKVPRYPEKIESPKEFLGELVRANSKTQYLNTVHNRRIASAISIPKLKCCPTFSDYPHFLRRAFNATLELILTDFSSMSTRVWC
jgi:hypothetical protein